MIDYQVKPVVFNLDDFCEEIMKPRFWKLIFRLKDRYPNFKVTMFTIPLRCSEEWLAMVQTYPWSDHRDRHEWMGKTDIDLPFQPYFYKGFKAPWWRMSQETADAFNREGYLLSTCRGYHDVTGPRVYRFNEGHPHIPMVWYERDDYYTVHSHVQPMKKSKDGLPDGTIHSRLMKAFPKNTPFLFISEVV